MLSDLELGWLAGIIDGEGTICGSVDRISRHGTIVVAVDVAVQNTSKELIDKIASLLGRCNVYFHARGPFLRSNSKKAVYRIDIWRKPEILKLLTILEPVLVAKKRQAQAVIAWITLWGDGRGRGTKQPSEEEKQGFVYWLRSMNKAA